MFGLNSASAATRRKQLRANAVKPQSADASDIPKIAHDNPVPLPPFWGSRVVKDIPLVQIYPYINENALFRGQWGYKQGKQTPEEFEKSTEENARPVFKELKRRAMEEGFLTPKVVYGYFPVQSSGNDLIVYHTEEFQGCTCHPGGPGRCSRRGTPRERLRFTLPAPGRSKASVYFRFLPLS